MGRGGERENRGRKKEENKKMRIAKKQEPKTERGRRGGRGRQADKQADRHADRPRMRERDTHTERTRERKTRMRNVREFIEEAFILKTQLERNGEGEEVRQT